MGTLGWCLVAGTLIETVNGTKAIEDLRDGEVLVTTATMKDIKRPIEFGTVSNEARTVKVENPRLYGFSKRRSHKSCEIRSLPTADNEKPFFTASHVFHTTSGLRAIDAYAARKLNPASTIGELRVGHVLFRLDEKREYSFVVITEIHDSQASDVNIVYDLHLSKGRSYHANGFLTAVSYPEVCSDT